MEEKGNLIQLMHNKTVRAAMTDILSEFTAPKYV
jgi:hypothetical protein